MSHRRDGASPTDYTLKSTLARQEMEIDKHLLKIIQTSCKAEKLSAALDAALLLTQPASLEAAAKIAAFFRLPSLQERIILVQESKTGIRREEEENKRGGKWAHLVDERTVLASKSTTAAPRTKRVSLPSSSGTSAIFGSGRTTSAKPSRTAAPPTLDRSSEGPEEVEMDEAEVEMLDGELEPEEGSESERVLKRARTDTPDQEQDSFVEAEISPVVPKKGASLVLMSLPSLIARYRTESIRQTSRNPTRPDSFVSCESVFVEKGRSFRCGNSEDRVVLRSCRTQGSHQSVLACVFDSMSLMIFSKQLETPQQGKLGKAKRRPWEDDSHSCSVRALRSRRRRKRRSARRNRRERKNRKTRQRNRVDCASS